MQVPSSPHSTTSPPVREYERELAEALHLIAHGTGDEKVRYIAERDPDWFVDHVLDWTVDYVDRDAGSPPRRATDRAVLDMVIARLALRDRTFGALRESA